MSDNVSTLEKILRPQQQLRHDDTDAELPDLGEGEYQPYARPANKPVHSIHFISAKGTIRSFQYVHLDSNSRYYPEKIELRFMGMEPVRVTISGRNLWRVYDHVHQHRTAWVAEATRDFAADSECLISKVEFEVVSGPDSRL
jgi:hypothetical protein